MKKKKNSKKKAKSRRSEGKIKKFWENDTSLRNDEWILLEVLCNSIALN